MKQKQRNTVLHLAYMIHQVLKRHKYPGFEDNMQLFLTFRAFFCFVIFLHSFGDLWI